MENRQREKTALIISAVSFILMIVTVLVSFGFGLVNEAIVAVLLLFLFLWVGALVAAITYSENGWTVRGSTLEWIVSAVISPFGTLFLYFVSKEQEERDQNREPVDLRDEGRISKL